MFTTGSKWYLGLGALATVAGLISIATSDNPMYGTIVAFSLAAVAFFVGGVVIAFRDSDLPVAVAASATDAEGQMLTRTPITASAWPAIGALGGAVTLLGLILDRRLFLVGVALLALVTIEWAVQAWADRASGDAGYNMAVRNRVMRPIEIPILGVVLAAFVVLPFSQVMLALTKDGAVYVFMAFALVVFVMALVIAYAPRLGRNVLYGALALGALVVIVAGAVAVGQGERSFHHSEGGRTRYVSNKANMLATVTVEDGKLDIERLSIAKGLSVTLQFVNMDEEKRKLVIEAGKDPKTDKEFVFETAALDHDAAQVLTFTMPNSGTFHYVIEDEAGHEVAQGEILVP